MTRRTERDLPLRALGAWATLVLAGMGLLLVVLELAVPRKGGTPLEDTTLFPAAFGFLAFIAIVLGGAALRRLLGRGEDYYDRG